MLKKKFINSFVILLLIIATMPVTLANNFDEYMQDLRSKIQKNWNPPDFLETGHTVVQFKILRSGELEDAHIIEKSGDEAFDLSTMDALSKAQPFNKFPETTTRSYITINYSFDTTIVKTDAMREYLAQSDKFYKEQNYQQALKSINSAIAEVNGDINSYFLYARRSKIKKNLGDFTGAEEDFTECKRLKAKADKKRIITCKLIAEEEQTPYSYFALAHAYDIAGDYDNALTTIDKAINLTKLNNQYKRYKEEILEHSRQKSR